MEFQPTMHSALIRSKGNFWLAKIWKFDDEYFFQFGKNKGFVQLLVNRNTSFDQVYWKKIIPEEGWFVVETGLKLEFIAKIMS